MHNYSVNLAWSEREQEYLATSPEFPKLSAFAATAEEAVAELRAVIEVAVEMILEDGEEPPLPQFHQEYSGQFRLRIAKSLHRQLAERAEAECVSSNTLVAQYIAAGLALATHESRTAHRLETALSLACEQMISAVEIAWGGQTSFTPVTDNHQLLTAQPTYLSAVAFTNPITSVQ